MTDKNVHNEVLWCVVYDQQSYYQTFNKINFSLFLKNILRDKYFIFFQKQMSEEIKDKNQWNERCWALINFFEYLNIAFSSENLQENMLFVPDNTLRRAFGTLQMWVDLERLYLFTFLKLDRIEFQEDRIYMSLFRTFKFMKSYFLQHEITDFKPGFLAKISREISIKMEELQKLMPKYMNPLILDISIIIEHFIQGFKEIIPEIHEIQYKKIVYQKLIKLFQMTKEIQSRLQNNITYQNRFRRENKIQRLASQQYFQNQTQSLKYIYDTIQNSMKKMKQKAEKNGEEFDREKSLQSWENYQRKLQERIASQKPYETLMNTNHNPYEETNYAIFGEILAIDMQIKNKMDQDKKQKKVKKKQQNQTKIYYQQSYWLNALNKNIHYGKVQDEDLKFSLPENQNASLSQTNRGKLSNMKWEKYGYKNGKLPDTTDYSGKSDYKDVSNNVLFRADDEQMQNKVQDILLMKRGGYHSKVLYKTNQKAENVYDKINDQQLFSIERNSYQDRNKFDALRKVLMLSTVERKLANLIRKDIHAQFCNRNLDQIRQYHIDPMVTQKKIDKALSET